VFKSKAKAKAVGKAIVKKFIKKNTAKLTIKSSKLKKKKKIFVRVRAYLVKSGARVFGDWSNVKKVKVK